MMLMLLCLVVLCLVPFEIRELTYSTEVQPLKRATDSYDKVVEEVKEEVEVIGEVSEVRNDKLSKINPSEVKYDSRNDPVTEEEALEVLRAIYEGGRKS